MTTKRTKRIRSKRNSPPKLIGPMMTFRRVDTIPLVKSASDGGNALWKTLNDFSVSDIVSLFSMYRVRQVKLTFRLVNAPNNNATFPTLWIAPRQYSTTAPTSLDEVQQYNGVRSYQFGPNKVSYTQVFKPSIQLVTQGTTTIPGITLPGSEEFVSTDNVLAQYIFGVFWLQRYNNTTDPTHSIEIDYDVLIDAKAPR